MAKRGQLQRAAKRKRLGSRATTDTVVTSMVLPRELHRRATTAAYDLNWSMAELTRRAVEEFLDRHDGELRKENRS
jgi:hypothetical protein